MTLTENDKLFLIAVQNVSRDNRELKEKKSIVTNRALISNELLELLGILPNASGGWVFNVYVTFEAMFKEEKAKEWQQ